MCVVVIDVVVSSARVKRGNLFPPLVEIVGEVEDLWNYTEQQNKNLEHNRTQKKLIRRDLNSEDNR